MLTRFFISRWQLTLIMFLLLAAMGANALISIPRSVDPHFPIPIIGIVAVQPGADAQDMEETVAKPIEDVLQSLEDIEEIQSTSTDGAISFAAEFNWGGDPDKYFDDVVREVNAIRETLPANLQRLEFRKVQTTGASVLQLALVSETASWRRMEKYADDLTDRMSRNLEVRETEIFGIPQPEVSVEIDSGRLAELQLPASIIVEALARGGVEAPIGGVTSGQRRLNVKAGGAFRDLAAIRNIPLRTAGDNVLSIDDVAKVRWAAAEPLSRTLHNGQRAAFIVVRQKDQVDVIRLREQLEKDIAAQRLELPDDIELVVQFDQSKDVIARLSELTRDFSIAVFLVLFTLLPLGIRSSFIVMISIPLSLASGLLMLFYSGYNLSQLSIAGFIVSLGLLVDDSIVVTENIARHLRMGKSRVQAAIEGTHEITAAVLGSTFVLIFAFAPLLLIPGGGGGYSRSFTLSVIYTVTASLIISFTIVPFLASRLLRRDENPDGNALLRWLNRWIEKIYRPVLRFGLAKPWRTLVASLALCFSAFALVPVMGFTLFPDADVAYFRITVETEQGSSLAHSRKVVDEVEQILVQEPDIVTRAVNVGRGNPQTFYNVPSKPERLNFSEILVVMDDWHSRESPAMIERLRERLDQIAGARIKVITFQNGAPVDAPVALRVTGSDLDIIREIAGQVTEILNRTPGARDVINPLGTDRIDLDMAVDGRQAALLNIAAGEPRRAARIALNGERAALFRDSEGDDYPVVVRLPLRDGHSISTLDQIYVATRDGSAVPLSQISEPQMKSVPPQIERYQLSRAITVTAQVEPTTIPSRVTQFALDEIGKLDLPEGYAISVGGESEAVAETFGDFGPIIIGTLLVIFAILVAEFKRFRETIVVAGVIPLGTFGGIIALFLTGNSVSFMAVIGFIALIGIEIKNSILLVDFTTKLRDEGMGLRDAIEEAGRVRFLPVLLTSVTAIGGLLPLAIFGGALYSPVAIIIIGGLISSTILSRLVTPVMYWLIARGAEARENEKKSGQGGDDSGLVPG